MAPAADDRSQPLDARFREAFDSILDLVVVERAVRDDAGAIVDFEILWMNNAPVDVAGRPRQELIGRRISELYPALAGGELIDSYRRVVETGEPLVVPSLAYSDVIDGREVAGYYTVQATRFEDGVLVASRDITPLETSRLELEIALRELEAAQRLARLGTWRIDLLAQTVTLSEQLERILGLERGTATGVTMDALARVMHPADDISVKKAHQRAINTRRAVVIEHRVVRADGTVAHVRTYSEPVVADDEVVGLWGTTQDISDTVASRDALDAEHLRRVSAEALADLAATLGDVRTPQDVAEAVYGAVDLLGAPAAVSLGVVELEDAVLRQHYAGTAVPGDIQARYLRTPLSVDTPLTRAVNAGRALFLGDLDAQAHEFPAHARDASSTGLASVVVLPLENSSGIVFGALSLSWPQPRHFDQETRVRLTAVRRAVGRTVERVQLLELERSVAQTLQLGLLALDVRSTNTIIRARYQASDAAMEVGGDWYDAVDVGNGRVAVAVGDVVGRGLRAATTMSQLRAALGVSALQARDASEAIAMLDNYASHVAGAKCTTVAFAIVDADAQTVQYVCGGHPPPLLVTPDGVVRYLEGGRSWPLNVEATRPRGPAASAHLPPASLLLLFTDGLVERRGEPIDAGFQRLATVVAEHWNLPLRRLKQAIFGALVDTSAGALADDIAILALRTTGAADSLFADAFPAVPAQARPARQRLSDWLDRVGLGGEQRDALLLAVGEAVANAIDHGSCGDESQIVRVELALRGRTIIASVSDSGQWQPGVDGYFSGRGRGHLLMESLTDDVSIDTDQHGTIVTLTLARVDA